MAHSLYSADIDFSAQFGGRDAADFALKDFNALKEGAKGLSICDFPAAKMAFILRVDGEIHSFNMSGLSHLDAKKTGEYISVDINISAEDRSNLQDVICESILSSYDFLEANLNDKLFKTINKESMQGILIELCENYRKTLSEK